MVLHWKMRDNASQSCNAGIPKEAMRHHTVCPTLHKVGSLSHVNQVQAQGKDCHPQAGHGGCHTLSRYESQV